MHIKIEQNVSNKTDFLEPNKVFEKDRFITSSIIHTD